MTLPDEPSGAARAAGHAQIAALPLAAALTLAVARVLPLEFTHRPNTLGIVSVATVREYPVQQETFWFVFAVGFGVLAALALAAGLGRRSWSTGRGIALEMAGIATLAALLLLPAWVAWLPALAVAALVRSAPRRGSTPEPRAAAETQPAASQPAGSCGWGTRAAWAGALLVLALGMNPLFTVHAARLAAGVPDEALTVDDWNFHGESGQHLAWADAIREGRMQGRDYFSLYGPYFDLGLVGLWRLVGRSLAAWNVYDAAQFALGYLGALLLGWLACRRKLAALALVPLARWIFLRYGFGLFALAALVPWLRGGARAWCGAAGLVGGFALLYSQEFGVAFLLCAGLALAVRGDARALAWFAGGLALPVAPILVWFLSEGALAPLLRDMAGYPAWLAAGYGKLPFPALLGNLPLDVTPPTGPLPALLRLAYVGPAVCAGAFALSAMAAPLEPRRLWRFPLALRSAWRARPETLLVALLALYGLVSFRSALGRSDEPHIVFVLGAPALLLVLAFDRTLGLFRTGERALGVWRLLVLAGLAWFGGLPRAADSLATLRASAANAWQALTGELEAPQGSAEVNAVAEWVRAHTTPEDRVGFVPAGAAYLYLSERRDPTRFVLSHQMVTDAHRSEALEDMRRAPPRYVVFDPGALRVDGIPDRIVLGEELSDWLARNYEPETTIQGVRIHRRRPAAPK